MNKVLVASLGVLLAALTGRAQADSPQFYFCGKHIHLISKINKAWGYDYDDDDGIPIRYRVPIGVFRRTVIVNYKVSFDDPEFIIAYVPMRWLRFGANGTIISFRGQKCTQREEYVP